MASFLKVKGPAGELMEFSEGIEENFKRLYNNWGQSGYTGEKTIMCPPLFPRVYLSPVNDASGANPRQQGVGRTIKGDDAEEKIFNLLKEFAGMENPEMFVLTKLKFTDFIKYLNPDLVLQNKQRQFQAEIDFAIIHLQIGVILVEVKATKWSQDEYFIKQLSKVEKIIRGLLPEESPIPVFKVVAFPNVDGKGFREDDLICLPKSNVDSCTEFKNWMEKNFVKESCRPFDNQEILTLLHKLVAQKTVLPLPEKGIAIQFTDDEVKEDKQLSKWLERISNQGVLKQSYNSQTRRGWSERPTVVKTEDIPGMDELSHQILFLNLEQISVWEGQNHQVICGVPGSGKTILIQYQALECAKKGEKVIVCVPTPLDKHYEAFFAAYDRYSSEVIICSFENLSNLVNLQEEEKFHLFADEVQIILRDFFLKYLLTLLLLKQKTPEGWYCWLAYDPGQCPLRTFVVSDSCFTDLMESQDEASLKKIVELLGDDCEDSSRSETLRFAAQLQDLKSHKFQRSILTTAMRSTVSILNFLRYIWPSEPQLCFKIGHRISGPKIEISRTESELVENILKETRSLKKVAVLYTDNSDGQKLPTILERSRIPFCAAGEKQEDGMVVLDRGRNALSLEWPVVFAVCADVGLEKADALFRTIVSRTVLKLIIHRQGST